MTIKRFATIVAAAAAVAMSGALGGLLAFSYCAGLLPFNQDNKENLPPVRVTENKITTIQENKALKDAAAKVFGAVIGVKATGAKGAASYGSGVILTSDGLAVLPNDLFPAGATAKITAAGKTASFEVLKRDKALNLVILKLENANWSTAGFYQMDDLEPGERVFLAGMLASGDNFVNEGLVRDFTLDAINTNIYEKAEVLGAPAFDIEGNIMGICDIDKSGKVSVIPISKIRELSGL
ncbi:MAG: trypsin-like peptidase domain-containing protein [Minisyncoccales bacterium]